ncbi:unnamed protein product [Adineta ricciae]|uniref:Uncharacterized protein n=1 Tax=Adineta ricciae TaxID=249248 RepID=A0A815W4T3_ADIRI|nr:unnamed protein product [Adineta ricciae]
MTHVYEVKEPIIMSKGVNQLNRDLCSYLTRRTIERSDPDCSEKYHRFIHAHSKDGSALYITDEWKHDSRKLTNTKKE